MTRAKGSFDFFNRECVVGTALRVDRMNLGGQLASSEGVQLDLWIVSYRRHWLGILNTHIGRQDDGRRG